MRVLVVIAALLALGGCARRPADAPEPGEMVALWDGREPGRLRVAAEAMFCARDSVVELFAYQDDRAVGLAFYLAGEEVPEGDLAVVPPGTRPLPRPAVAGVFRAALRDAMAGFVGQSGEVTVVSTADGQLTGRFTLTLTERSTMDPLTVRGAFREVPVQPAHEPCGRRAPAAVAPDAAEALP